MRKRSPAVNCQSLLSKYIWIGASFCEAAMVMHP
jgi:hypothetical protein